MSSAREQVARLLALVPYLQTQGEVPLSQVAADFGVSPAQVRKDLGVLWMCGLPGLTPDRMIDVDMEALEDDPDGVVHIDNAEFLSRPVRLGSSEASALIVALRALRESGREASHEVVDRALAKLEEAAATGAAPAAVEVHLSQDGSAEHATALRTAIAENHQVQLSYYVPTRDESTRRRVDPVAVVSRDGHDYLDAWCHLATARRLFRLDRIEAVEVLPEARTEPDLAPRDLSEGLFEPGPDAVRAVVHLARPARWVADYHPVDAVEEIGDGRLAVHLRLEDPRWLVRLALRLAPDVRVVEPPALAAEVEATARRALALHASGPDDGDTDGGRA